MSLAWCTVSRWARARWRRACMCRIRVVKPLNFRHFFTPISRSRFVPPLLPLCTRLHPFQGICVRVYLTRFCAVITGHLQHIRPRPLRLRLPRQDHLPTLHHLTHLLPGRTPHPHHCHRPRLLLPRPCLSGHRPRIQQPQIQHHPRGPDRLHRLEPLATGRRQHG